MRFSFLGTKSKGVYRLCAILAMCAASLVGQSKLPCWAQFGLIASPDPLPLFSATVSPADGLESVGGNFPAVGIPEVSSGLSRLPPPDGVSASVIRGKPKSPLTQAIVESNECPMPDLPQPLPDIRLLPEAPEATTPTCQPGTMLIDEMLNDHVTRCPEDPSDPSFSGPRFSRKDYFKGYGTIPGGEWCFNAGGLIMGRNDPNRVWFSYQSNNNANELMSSEQARTGWQGGWFGTLGRSLGYDNWRLEGTYWGLAKMTGDASATHPEFVSSTLDFSDVVYANPAIPGLPVDLFTGAYEQALWRSNEIHNAEINLLRHRIPWEGYRLGIDWLVGVRYFRFDERLTYGSRRHSGAWGAVPELEGYLSDRVENDLVGVQLGFDLRWPLTDCLVVSCRPKVGLYNNHIRNRFDAYRGDGELFAPNPNPPLGDPVPGRYPVVSADNRFSVLTEIEARLTWQIGARWSAYVGYRLVAVSEIALADEQYPFYVVDIVDAIQYIDSNGDLLVHGGVAGITFTF